MSNPYYARYVPPKAPETVAPSVVKSITGYNGAEHAADVAQSKKRKRDKGDKKAFSKPTRKAGEITLSSNNGTSQALAELPKKKGKKLRSQKTGSAKKTNEASPERENNAENQLRPNEGLESDDNMSYSALAATDPKAERAKSAGGERYSLAQETDSEPERSERPETGHTGGSHVRKHATILSKFQKSMKFSEAQEKHSAEDIGTVEDAIVNDLRPLPQPQQPEESLPLFSTLPAWLANPVTVPADAEKRTFDELGINPDIIKLLENQRCEKPSEVQAAVLPLLMPTQDQHPGDLCVSAPTGSGKTLAYVLPILHSLKSLNVTKLRAVIIVPTRELVNQVRLVFEAYNAGTGLRIGIATGSQSFKQEQDALILLGRKYDPEGYDKLCRRLHPKQHGETFRQTTSNNIKATISSDTDSDDSDIDDDFREMVFNLVPGNVPAYSSQCDVLICTPGRLVDHIKSTAGFSLHHVEWLVIDEADRLLDQSFQEWTGVLLESLAEKSHRARNLADSFDTLFPEISGNIGTKAVRKIILSATMTRELAKLDSLRFKLPKLVLVGGDPSRRTETRLKADPTLEQGNEEVLNLPFELREHAMAVGDGSEKPLYLLKFLQNVIFASQQISKASLPSKKAQEKVKGILEGGSTSRHHVAQDSDTSSDTSSYVSSSSSSVDSSDDGEFEGSSSSDDQLREKSKKTRSNSKDGSALILPRPRNVLIFVNSNEAAARLARLLAILHPPFKDKIRALTKGSASKSDTKILSAFRDQKVSILIASDRASRGLDLPNLTDVVNYDMPRSVTSYVHRVGRTARAGKAGQSWTFFTDPEGWWFWNRIARSSDIGRGSREVERLKLGDTEQSAALKEKYAIALRQLGTDVHGDKGR